MDALHDSSIEFDRLSKYYGPHRVLADMTVRVRPGSVTGLLGPNGSGKTTALRLLLGLERPDAGEARIGGRRYFIGLGAGDVDFLWGELAAGAYFAVVMAAVVCVGVAVVERTNAR